jgi:hypothetical protein
MTALWLADALRAGGCTVDERPVPDWQSRGHTDGPFDPVGVIGHHTAGPAAGDLPSLATVRDGRPDLAGPLANLMLSRAGVWVPIAAGRCWHAGGADRAAAWPWIGGGDGNGRCIGIEAESTGRGDWTAAQLEAFPRGVAALLRHLGAGADRYLGHLEWAPSRKIDPAGWPGGMAGFRGTVAAILGAPLPPGAQPAPPAAPGGLPTLQRGMTNDPRVAALQRFLNAYGWRPALPILPATGNYLDQTVAVVKAAQAQCGVTGPDADGTIVGPRTAAAFRARGATW